MNRQAEHGPRLLYQRRIGRGIGAQPVVHMRDVERQPAGVGQACQRVQEHHAVHAAAHADDQNGAFRCVGRAQ